VEFAAKLGAVETEADEPWSSAPLGESVDRLDDAEEVLAEQFPAAVEPGS
jgi:hypothetical protein